MDLWIRSQDREDLVKANALYIMNNQIWNEVPFYENHKKLGLTVTGHNHKLAEYSTKERTLEVLDEIQGLFIKKDIVKCELNKNGLTMVNMPITCIVYEMPKE